ncbi:hypothetical protein E4T38_07999 [Aureobasidium subglaciale]|nr:hypothetical protein E4T38_07999 [Aureobasidium subglaciale]KAI5216325.1 hypothetical protein E4T40_08009 [Aureobasidium subglaciale]KAI5219576.1 hypothetical protein E4T41_07924 [Aureobasidium subglaciale]KAI5257617.1 hypothetical protein E4T46_07900 [Aureobasidium subglaciale]
MEITARPRTKKSHLKRRTGCNVCRERRVRCDETRPTCQNCVRHSRKKHVSCTYHVSGDQEGLATQDQQIALLRGHSHATTMTRSPNTTPLFDLNPKQHFLIHHTNTIALEAQACHFDDTNIGSNIFIKAIERANAVPFLRHCVCNLAAQHLYGLTRTSDLLCEQLYHRGMALSGLREHFDRLDVLDYESIIIACHMLSLNAANSRSSVVELFLPIPGKDEIAKWRADGSDLLESALRSLNNLVKLAKGKPALLAAAKELKNHLINTVEKPENGLTEPGQVKAVFPVRSWLPWFPTIRDYMSDGDPHIMSFLANFEMVKMVQALVMPETRYYMALRRRAQSIKWTCTQLQTLSQTVDLDLSGVMEGPLRIANSYLNSLSAYRSNVQEL